ncbi:fungal-specific transcription factor domain-containing protein [Panaeolus papilionaceus]|nr:fungal-specific transcription factor domain-containing protein [Panaeolus papilionaceus]
MEWRDSEPSDDEHVQQDGSHTTSRKRSSRACDQCRKTKSKCERGGSGDSKKCKSCALSGSQCTYLGPSYKRGPPKGYIHAIEQRWHQVEALLGSILQCPDPRVQSIVSDLRQDDLAREILGRVDSGPYGPSRRRSQPADTTKEDFFASIMKSNESSHVDSSRSRRQSRVSREIVSSNQDHGLAVVPTKEWQDNLSKRLTFGTASPTARFAESTSGHVTQRRRLVGPESPATPEEWNSLYTIDSSNEVDEFKNTTDSMGQLSLDEHQEVRFHGHASGLHLLGRSERTDDRIEGGIWRLPMARVWPPSKFGITTYPHGPVDTELPPQHIQEELLDVYFTNIHPVFPVIHKTRFLSEYRNRKQNDGRTFSSPALSTSSTYSSPRPEPSQEVTPLLLFSIFAIAARFLNEDPPKSPDNKMWDAGCEYLDSARSILNKIFHISRPSTVQSLLLLGYREFGIGSMEQGWIFIGTAIRMAFDLGLNCDSGKWRMHGHELFSPEETQVRRQIWWACILTDRYGSMYMGRPIMIKDEDFETPLPNVDPLEERQQWVPTSTRDNLPYPPVPSRAMSSFCASSRLAIIIGAIIGQIYPVRPTPGVARKSLLPGLESRLDQWYITLPEELRYDAPNKRYTPPPQILLLHLRYWGAVLLLHRAFIPNWKGPNNDRVQKNSAETRAFDLAHSAACHIGSIVTTYRDTFTMRRPSPFLTSYLLSAAIMHILTMTVKLDNIEASMGLQQCMAALKEMEVVWPSASRAWDLLNGVQLRTWAHNQNGPPQYSNVDRNKRAARDAFGDEQAPTYVPREPFGDPGPSPRSDDVGQGGTGGVQDMSTRLMAHMLGLEIPGVEPSTSYFPGYEWWPRVNQGNQPGLTPQQPYPLETEYQPPIPVMDQNNSENVTPSVESNANTQWLQDPGPQSQTYPMALNYTYNFGQY